MSNGASNSVTQVVGPDKEAVISHISTLLKESYLDKNYNNSQWQMESMSIVNNETLEQNYSIKREELNSNRGPDALKECILFTCYRGKHGLKDIFCNGLFCKSSGYNFLGDSSKGTLLCRYADVQLKAASVKLRDKCWLCIFLVTPGRTATTSIDSLNSPGSNSLKQPKNEYDCFLSESFPRPNDEISFQAKCSQIYLYDPDLRSVNGYRYRPRQCIPFAYIVFRSPLLGPCETAVYHLDLSPSRDLDKIQNQTDMDGEDFDHNVVGIYDSIGTNGGRPLGEHLGGIRERIESAEYFYSRADHLESRQHQLDTSLSLNAASANPISQVNFQNNSNVGYTNSGTSLLGATTISNISSSSANAKTARTGLPAPNKNSFEKAFSSFIGPRFRSPAAQATFQNNLSNARVIGHVMDSPSQNSPKPVFRLRAPQARPQRPTSRPSQQIIAQFQTQGLVPRTQSPSTTAQFRQQSPAPQFQSQNSFAQFMVQPCPNYSPLRVTSGTSGGTVLRTAVPIQGQRYVILPNGLHAPVRFITHQQQEYLSNLTIPLTTQTSASNVQQQQRQQQRQQNSLPNPALNPNVQFPVVSQIASELAQQETFNSGQSDAYDWTSSLIASGLNPVEIRPIEIMLDGTGDIDDDGSMNAVVKTEKSRSAKRSKEVVVIDDDPVPAADGEIWNEVCNFQQSGVPSDKTTSNIVSAVAFNRLDFAQVARGENNGGISMPSANNNGEVDLGLQISNVISLIVSSPTVNDPTRNVACTATNTLNSPYRLTASSLGQGMISPQRIFETGAFTSFGIAPMQYHSTADVRPAMGNLGLISIAPNVYMNATTAVPSKNSTTPVLGFQLTGYQSAASCILPRGSSFQTMSPNNASSGASTVVILSRGYQQPATSTQPAMEYFNLPSLNNSSAGVTVVHPQRVWAPPPRYQASRPVMGSMGSPNAASGNAVFRSRSSTATVPWRAIGPRPARPENASGRPTMSTAPVDSTNSPVKKKRKQDLNPMPSGDVLSPMVIADTNLPVKRKRLFKPIKSKSAVDVSTPTRLVQKPLLVEVREPNKQAVQFRVCADGSVELELDNQESDDDVEVDQEQRQDGKLDVEESMPCKSAVEVSAAAQSVQNPSVITTCEQNKQVPMFRICADGSVELEFDDPESDDDVMGSQEQSREIHSKLEVEESVPCRELLMKSLSVIWGGDIRVSNEAGSKGEIYRAGGVNEVDEGDKKSADTVGSASIENPPIGVSDNQADMQFEIENICSIDLEAWQTDSLANRNNSEVSTDNRVSPDNALCSVDRENSPVRISNGEITSKISGSGDLLLEQTAEANSDIQNNEIASPVNSKNDKVDENATGTSNIADGLDLLKSFLERQQSRASDDEHSTVTGNTTDGLDVLKTPENSQSSAGKVDNGKKADQIVVIDSDEDVEFVSEEKNVRSEAEIFCISDDDDVVSALDVDAEKVDSAQDVVSAQNINEDQQNADHVLMSNSKGTEPIEKEITPVDGDNVGEKSREECEIEPRKETEIEMTEEIAELDKTSSEAESTMITSDVVIETGEGGHVEPENEIEIETIVEAGGVNCEVTDDTNHESDIARRPSLMESTIVAGEVSPSSENLDAAIELNPSDATVSEPVTASNVENDDLQQTASDHETQSFEEQPSQNEIEPEIPSSVGVKSNVASDSEPMLPSSKEDEICGTETPSGNREETPDNFSEAADEFEPLIAIDSELECEVESPSGDKDEKFCSGLPEAAVVSDSLEVANNSEIVSPSREKDVESVFNILETAVDVEPSVAYDPSKDNEKRSIDIADPSINSQSSVDELSPSCNKGMEPEQNDLSAKVVLEPLFANDSETQSAVYDSETLTASSEKFDQSFQDISESSVGFEPSVVDELVPPSSENIETLSHSVLERDLELSSDVDSYCGDKIESRLPSGTEREISTTTFQPEDVVPEQTLPPDSLPENTEPEFMAASPASEESSLFQSLSPPSVKSWTMFDPVTPPPQSFENDLVHPTPSKFQFSSSNSPVSPPPTNLRLDPVSPASSELQFESLSPPSPRFQRDPVSPTTSTTQYDVVSPASLRTDPVTPPLGIEYEPITPASSRKENPDSEPFQPVSSSMNNIDNYYEPVSPYRGCRNLIINFESVSTCFTGSQQQTNSFPTDARKSNWQSETSGLDVLDMQSNTNGAQSAAISNSELPDTVPSGSTSVTCSPDNDKRNYPRVDDSIVPITDVSDGAPDISERLYSSSERPVKKPDGNSIVANPESCDKAQIDGEVSHENNQEIEFNATLPAANITDTLIAGVDASLINAPNHNLNNRPPNVETTETLVDVPVSSTESKLPSTESKLPSISGKHQSISGRHKTIKGILRNSQDTSSVQHKKISLADYLARMKAKKSLPQETMAVEEKAVKENDVLRSGTSGISAPGVIEVPSRIRNQKDNNGSQLSDNIPLRDPRRFSSKLKQGSNSSRDVEFGNRSTSENCFSNKENEVQMEKKNPELEIAEIGSPQSELGPLCSENDSGKDSLYECFTSGSEDEDTNKSDKPSNDSILSATTSQTDFENYADGFYHLIPIDIKVNSEQTAVENCNKTGDVQNYDTTSTAVEHNSTASLGISKMGIDNSISRNKTDIGVSDSIDDALVEKGVEDSMGAVDTVMDRELGRSGEILAANVGNLCDLKVNAEMEILNANAGKPEQVDGGQALDNSRNEISRMLDRELLEISIDFNAIEHDIDKLGGSEQEGLEENELLSEPELEKLSSNDIDAIPSLHQDNSLKSFNVKSKESKTPKNEVFSRNERFNVKQSSKQGEQLEQNRYHQDKLIGGSRISSEKLKLPDHEVDNRDKRAKQLHEEEQLEKMSQDVRESTGRSRQGKQMSSSRATSEKMKISGSEVITRNERFNVRTSAGSPERSQKDLKIVDNEVACIEEGVQDISDGLEMNVQRGSVVSLKRSQGCESPTSIRQRRLQRFQSECNAIDINKTENLKVHLSIEKSNSEEVEGNDEEVDIFFNDELEGELKVCDTISPSQINLQLANLDSVELEYENGGDEEGGEDVCVDVGLDFKSEEPLNSIENFDSGMVECGKEGETDDVFEEPESNLEICEVRLISPASSIEDGELFEDSSAVDTSFEEKKSRVVVGKGDKVNKHHGDSSKIQIGRSLQAPAMQVHKKIGHHEMSHQESRKEKRRKSHRNANAWQDISSSWVDICKDKDVLATDGSGITPKECGRAYSQVLEYIEDYRNLSKSRRKKISNEMFNSLEATKKQIIHELVYEDLTKKLDLSTKQSLKNDNCRPLVLKEIETEDMVRKIEREIAEAKVNPYSVPIAKNTKDPTVQHAFILRLSKEIAFNEINGLKRYYKSGFVYTLPEDLRLQPEHGKFISVEGTLLILKTHTIPLNDCRMLYCFKIEIEDTRRMLKECADDDEGKQEIAHRLGYLYFERKQCLDNLCCVSAKNRNVLLNEFQNHFRWYKSMVSMLTAGNKIEGGQQFLKFTYERVDCLEKYMNILKMSSVQWHD